MPQRVHVQVPSAVPPVAFREGGGSEGGGGGGVGSGAGGGARRGGTRNASYEVPELTDSLAYSVFLRARTLACAASIRESILPTVVCVMPACRARSPACGKAFRPRVCVARTNNGVVWARCGSAQTARQQPHKTSIT